MKIVFILLASHFIGDYILQTDFLAKTKGDNIWHLFIHSVLYSLPFMIAFGFNWKVPFIIGTHIVIDALKARYKVINYVTDQVLHLMALMIYVI